MYIAFVLSQKDIKFINALKIKKYRNKYSLFIAEGAKIIKELIAEGLEVINIYGTNDDFKEFKQFVQVSDATLSKITALKNHHQYLAIVKIPSIPLHLSANEWILLLDDIQDPGNLGTIIRTCDWFGIKKIVCSNGCVDAYNPKVVQASMASIGRVQIWEADLSNTIDSYPYPVYGAVFNGKNYKEQSFQTKGFILIGNEGHGIHPTLISKITFPVTIPKIGQAESLNAAIATALIVDKLQ